MDAGLWPEAFALSQLQVGAAEHAFPDARQVAVADQAEITRFAEPNSDAVSSHRSLLAILPKDGGLLKNPKNES
jgi:hypothetical protein